MAGGARPRAGRPKARPRRRPRLTTPFPSAPVARRARGRRCWPVAARPAGQPGPERAPAVAEAAPKARARAACAPRAARRRSAPAKMGNEPCAYYKTALPIWLCEFITGAWLQPRVTPALAPLGPRQLRPLRLGPAPARARSGQLRGGCRGVAACAGHRRGGLGGPHWPWGALLRALAAPCNTPPPGRRAAGRASSAAAWQQRSPCRPAGRAWRPAAQRAPSPATLASAFLCRPSPAQPSAYARSRRTATQAWCC